MNQYLTSLDQFLSQRSWAQTLLLASSLVVVVGLLDFLTGFDVSVSVFYLAPVTLSGWYGGRRMAVGVGVLACVSWFAADMVMGRPYGHPAVETWNLLVRFGFFLVTALLVTSLRQSLEQERQLARTDTLTGLLSRRAFLERLEHDIELSRRHRTPLTLAFIDLDNFKALNDSRGHAAGDQALRTTAARMKQELRLVDSVARLGGDEFAIALLETGRSGAENVIGMLRAKLRASLHDFAPNLSCSIGVVTFVDPPKDAQSALIVADELMYRGKHSGKNTVLFTEHGDPTGSLHDLPMSTRRKLVNRR